MSIALALKISGRYRKAKLKNRFISFISFSSTLGIALGVAALIISLSVMNGFQRELVNRLLSIIPHIEYVAVNRPIYNYQEKLKAIENHPQVLAAAPFVPLKGMVQKADKLYGIELRGVDPVAQLRVSNIQNYLIKGDWSALSRNDDGLIVGSGVADKLGVKLGDTVQIMLPRLDGKGGLRPPRYAHLKVEGIFKMGGQLDFSLGYISLHDARELTGLAQNAVEGYRLQIKDVFKADELAREIGMKLTDTVYMISWFRSQGHLYQDIQLVRFIMYLVLFIVIAVASFNIVSTLVMAVKEKQSDIAILKTMGADDSTIIMTFMFQGLGNGIKGIIVGVAVGVGASLYLPQMFVWLEHALGKQFLQDDIYFIDFLPSQLMWQDVAVAAAIALVTSIVATLYPSRQATKVQPAVVLGQQ